MILPITRHYSNYLFVEMFCEIILGATDDDSTNPELVLLRGLASRSKAD